MEEQRRVIIVGPETLIARLLADPALGAIATEAPPATVGGPLAGRGIAAAVAALEIFAAALAILDHGEQVAVHIKTWMIDTRTPACELWIKPEGGDQQILRIRPDMDKQDVAQLFAEVIQSTGDR